MYHRRLRKPSKPAIFATLMLASTVMVLLPRDFFASARNMTQLVALPGYAVSRAADNVAQSAKALADEPVPAREHQATLRAKQAVENENLALLGEVNKLRDRVAELQQLRNHPQFPGHSRLIPARVVGWDAVPGRDSMVLLKGRSASVKEEDWVTSRVAVQSGTEEGVQNDFRVLARQTLIGWVEQSAPYTSRVALLSDPYANKVWRVHVIAVNRENRPNEFVPSNQERADFALEGIGEGRMRILDINARYVNENLIRVGDVVCTDGHDPKLPLTMVIGEIVELEQVKKQPLLYYAIVEHRFDPKGLDEVFVLDASK